MCICLYGSRRLWASVSMHENRHGCIALTCSQPWEIVMCEVGAKRNEWWEGYSGAVVQQLVTPYRTARASCWESGNASRLSLQDGWKLMLEKMISHCLRDSLNTLGCEATPTP